MLSEKEYAFWLSSIEGLGTKTAFSLINFFGDVESLYKADVRDIPWEEKASKRKPGTEENGVVKSNDADNVDENMAGNEVEKKPTYTLKKSYLQDDSFLYLKRTRSSVIHRLINKKSEDEIKRDYEKLEKRQIHFTYYGEEEYPEKLYDIDGAPFSLYYKGKLPTGDKKSVAVVGARNADYSGFQIAKSLSKQMADHGIEVISGLARGIDSSAHRGALDSAGGVTYAVEGCGVDICYPRSNIDLYSAIIERGGVMSEYPLGTNPIAGNFPMRNRIISGLSDAVLLVEAGEKSGSLITANVALEQGKDIFVVPGNIMDPLYKGSNNLIKEGANLVTCVKDILDGLGIFVDDDINEKLERVAPDLSELEKQVYEYLNLNPIHLTEICYKSGLDSKDVIFALMRLELKGVVREVGSKYYAIVL
ncbi:MAG: DNA-processing protein DprA [Lachnospiraceae bacterium]|nr:DNA-processing protein DprA [Lachnospiraceae bacterium]